jgi:hypothetical protein
MKLTNKETVHDSKDTIGQYLIVGYLHQVSLL